MTGKKLTNIAPIVFLVLVIGVILYSTLTPTYNTATLKGVAESYLPVEIITVPYSDTMKLGKRIWYDGKMWTAIRFE